MPERNAGELVGQALSPVGSAPLLEDWRIEVLIVSGRRPARASGAAIRPLGNDSPDVPLRTARVSEGAMGHRSPSPGGLSPARTPRTRRTQVFTLTWVAARRAARCANWLSRPAPINCDAAHRHAPSRSAMQPRRCNSHTRVPTVQACMLTCLPASLLSVRGSECVSMADTLAAPVSDGHPNRNGTAPDAQTKTV